MLDLPAFQHAGGIHHHSTKHGDHPLGDSQLIGKNEANGDRQEDHIAANLLHRRQGLLLLALLLHARNGHHRCIGRQLFGEENSIDSNNNGGQDLGFQNIGHDEGILRHTVGFQKAIKTEMGHRSVTNGYAGAAQQTHKAQGEHGLGRAHVVLLADRGQNGVENNHLRHGASGEGRQHPNRQQHQGQCPVKGALSRPVDPSGDLIHKLGPPKAMCHNEHGRENDGVAVAEFAERRGRIQTTCHDQDCHSHHSGHRHVPLVEAVADQGKDENCQTDDDLCFH